MPTYWIRPQADIDIELPEDQGGDLSETFYGLIGAGYTTTFDRFPPVFTQIQRLAGVDFDGVLPLYISSRMTDRADLPAEIERVAKDLSLVRDRFDALYDALLRQPGWEHALVIPDKGFAPHRDYFEQFTGRPVPEQESWEIELYGPADVDPSLGADLRLVLRYLEHARRNGGTKFWLLGR